MSMVDNLRFIALEAAVVELARRVTTLEAELADTRACCDACQRAGTLAATPGAADCVPPSQWLSSAPGSDTVMADVVEALEAGQSIRGAADVLGIDRNKVFRLRQRAIAEGRLTVSPAETGQRGAAAAQYAAF